ncbi:MAG TPA: hypothetical protein VN377_01905 [Candidatus Thermoplasmatota archaeon]|nr:hypothetical protein [Candidatus Thermoplasmatota archaeon]
MGLRLNENGRLVERITLKIKMFDTGKWEWTVRQRFIKEPRIKLHDMLTILDEVKAEIIASEETEKQDEMTQEDAIPATQPETPKTS